MLKPCAQSAGQWSARGAKQLREFRARSLLSSPPAILRVAPPCVKGTGVLHQPPAPCESALSSSQVCFCLLFPHPSVLLSLKGNEELPGFPPPHQEELVVFQGAAGLILFSCSPPALLPCPELAGDQHCEVPAETGCCSHRACPWGRSKVS